MGVRMSRRLDCSICGTEKSHFVMQHKRVCLQCDELLFDLEIELDEEISVKTKASTEATREQFA